MEDLLLPVAAGDINLTTAQILASCVSPQASSLILFTSSQRLLVRFTAMTHLFNWKTCVVICFSLCPIRVSFSLSPTTIISFYMFWPQAHQCVWAPETATVRWSSLSCQGAGVYCGRHSLFGKPDDISMVVRSLCIIIRVGPLTGHTELHPFLLLFCPNFRVCAFLSLAPI
jgi:hypothetical protein